MTEFEASTQCGVTKEFDSEEAAEEGARTHETLCQDCSVGSTEISPLSEPSPDGGDIADTYLGTATTGPDLIFIYWMECSQCNYETAAHGRVACPDCGCTMTNISTAGAVVDDRTPKDQEDA